VSHKYSLSARDRWQHDHDVRLSNHAIIDQYDARTPTGAVAPETAYAQSLAGGYLRHAPVFKRRTNRNGDIIENDPPEQVRVFGGRTPEGEFYSVCFIVRAGGGSRCVTTIYTPETIQDPTVRNHVAGIAHRDTEGTVNATNARADP